MLGVAERCATRVRAWHIGTTGVLGYSTPGRCNTISPPRTPGTIFRGAGITSSVTELVSVSDDSDRTWNSMRRVPGSVCAVCATTARRVYRRGDHSEARSSNGATTNRSSIASAVGGRLRRTAHLSIKSVCNWVCARAAPYCTPTAITSAAGSAAMARCDNLLVHGISVFFCGDVDGDNSGEQQPRSWSH